MDDYSGDNVLTGRHIYHNLNLESPRHIKLNGVEVNTKVILGTIQSLSNSLTIGWHPDYESIINKKDDDNE